MKYTTFRNLVVTGLVLAGVGTCSQVRSCCVRQQHEDERALREEEERAERAHRAEREANQREAQEASARSQALADALSRKGSPGSFFAAAPGLRAVDQDVLALLQRPVVEKIKDGTRGKPYKVNLYADDKARWNRAKVDLDRDERTDESWTIHEDGQIERQVAPADDEKFTQTFRLDIRSGWVDVAASAAASSTAGSPPAGAAPGGLRPVDNDMLALLQQPPQAKIKDATKGKPYKINLYSDGGARFERAKVDLDRDDKWDESWTFKADGSTERQVSPVDDEAYTEVWVLSGGAWQRK